MVAGGYIRGSSSLRARPSPCSPERDPPWAATRSATSSAMRRTAATAPGARRSMSGRTCRHPTLAWPYQTDGTPSRSRTARMARANEAARSGGTAGSSTKASGLASPPPPRTRAMPARRTAQTAACSPGASRARAPGMAAIRSRTSSGAPLCSTTSSAGLPPAKPSSAASAGGRLAGSSRASSMSSIADGPASSRPGTASSAASTDG